MTQIFYVNHEDDDGENFDLVVEAASPEDAAALWRGYYEFVADMVPNRVFTVPTVTGTPRAWDWDEIVVTHLVGVSDDNGG